MNIHNFNEFALIFHVATCILNVWTSFLVVCVFFVIFLCFWTHPKRRAPETKEFLRYSNLQNFYQDPIDDQKDGWSEPRKCQSN